MSRAVAMWRKIGGTALPRHTYAGRTTESSNELLLEWLGGAARPPRCDQAVRRLEDRVDDLEPVRGDRAARFRAFDQDLGVLGDKALGRAGYRQHPVAAKMPRARVVVGDVRKLRGDAHDATSVGPPVRERLTQARHRQRAVYHGGDAVARAAQ